LKLARLGRLNHSVRATISLNAFRCVVQIPALATMTQNVALAALDVPLPVTSYVRARQERVAREKKKTSPIIICMDSLRILSGSLFLTGSLPIWLTSLIWLTYISSNLVPGTILPGSVVT